MTDALAVRALTRGREAVRARDKVARTTALLRCLGPVPTELHWTRWTGGVKRTGTGTPTRRGRGIACELTLADAAAYLESVAKGRPTAKGEGVGLAHGVSLYGGSADVEAEQVDWLFGDADGVGDWAATLAMLATHGVAYVAQRRVSAAGVPKFHVHLPLAKPIVAIPASERFNIATRTHNGRTRDELDPTPAFGEFKEKYRERYAFALGVLSELAELDYVADNAHKRGFDTAAANRTLVQAYVYCRLSPTDPTPETRWCDGQAIHFEDLLSVFGFEHEAKTPKRSSNARAATPRAANANDDDDHKLVRAFAAAGLLGRHYRHDKYAVECPWTQGHSSGAGAETSSFIRVDGVFHCSHTACAGRRGRDAEHYLRANNADARKVLDGDRDGDPGVLRLRAQLEQATPTPATLDAVEAAVVAAIRDTQAGELVVVEVPPGAGKSRAARRAVAEMVANGERPAVLVDTHKLATQTRELLVAEHDVHSQHRHGVLADVGVTACHYKPRAARYQAAGGSVSRDVCRTCEKRKTCEANKPIGVGPVLIAPHQLVRNAADDSTRLIVDEQPELTTGATLTPEDLVAAVELLAADTRTHNKWAYRRVFIAEYRALLAPFARVLAAVARSDRHDYVELANEVRDSYDGFDAFDEAVRFANSTYDAATKSQVPHPTRSFAPTADAYADARALAELASKEDAPRLMVFSKRRPRKGMWLDGLREDELVSVLNATRWCRAIRAAVRGFLVRDEPGGGRVVSVTVRTDVAEHLATAGGVVLSATPDLSALRALRPDARVVSVGAFDGAVIDRTVVYATRTHRSALAPERGDVEWSRFGHLLGDALERLAAKGRKRVLVVTDKRISELQAPPAVEATMTRWVADPDRDLAFAHYGSTRGLDTWASFDAFVTIGDPWPDLMAVADACASLGADPTDAGQRMARAELTQAHGRARDPSRKTPASHLHYGALAPLGWSATNTQVERMAVGSPSAASDPALTVELVELVAAVGGVRAAARIAGVGHRTIGRYVRGERVPPPAVMALLRRAAQVAPQPSTRERDLVEGYGATLDHSSSELDTAVGEW